MPLNQWIRLLLTISFMNLGGVQALIERPNSAYLRSNAGLSRNLPPNIWIGGAESRPRFAFHLISDWGRRNTKFRGVKWLIESCLSPSFRTRAEQERGFLPSRWPEQMQLNSNNWTKQLTKKQIPKEPTEQLNYWTFARWTKTDWTMIELNKFWIEHVPIEQLKRAYYEVF